MSISELLTSQLGGGVVGQLAGQIGADTGSTQKAVTAAVPLLLAAIVFLAKVNTLFRHLNFAQGSFCLSHLVPSLSPASSVINLEHLPMRLYWDQT